MNIGSLLTLVLLGLYLAARPWSVFASILLVTSPRGVVKATAFSCGWILALSLVATATVLFYPHLPKTSTERAGLSLAEVLAGLILGLWLLRRWRRPAARTETKEPTWMNRLDGVSPRLAFALGAFLPSYVVVMAAASEMLSSDLTTAWLAVTAALWVLLASSGVTAPIAISVVRADRAPEIYQSWREWLVVHTRGLLYLTAALVAVVLIAKGLAKLLA